MTEPADLPIAFIDDDVAVREAHTALLEAAGFEVESFAKAEAFLARHVDGLFGVLITDVRLPGIDGLALLTRCREIEPGLPVILITGHGDVAMAVEAMQKGAYDFIEKPFFAERLIEAIRRALERRQLEIENRRLRQALALARGLERSMIGISSGIRVVRQLVARLADTSTDVLILGETGTGKEVVARALHEQSSRRDKPYVALNCGALPESIFESELFGHEAGAFTGATKRRIGKIEYASGGTLFLDELESMPLALQVKLLRVLQERVVERLGGNALIPVDCRIVAATKADLLALAREGRFRADLTYRLNVVTLALPPLRERREDIAPLYLHFLREAAVRHELPIPDIAPQKLLALAAQDWPGNVRELRNAAEREVLGLGIIACPDMPENLHEQVDRFERALIIDALTRCESRVSHAADLLGVPRKTLYDKLRRHGLAPRRETGDEAVPERAA